MDLQATNPAQYDSPDLNWGIIGAEDNPTRIFFRAALDELLGQDVLHGRVLDAGCGVGHLFNWLKDKGVTEVVGIDPSGRNIQIAGERYPSVELHQCTIDEYAKQAKKKFDYIFVVLVFEHIRDLRQACTDLRGLMHTGGDLYVISGDMDYHITTGKDIRKNLISIDVVQELGDGALETRVVRGARHGVETTMYDIVRPTEHYRTMANEAGFELTYEASFRGPIGMPPELQAPNPMSHGFRFKAV
ncbi:MAG: class I SAM-dependent methyltransferase [Patescibacteria group bacterium]